MPNADATEGRVVKLDMPPKKLSYPAYGDNRKTDNETVVAVSLRKIND
jgi:hypothetical protein